MQPPHGISQIQQLFGASCRSACHGGIVLLPAPIDGVTKFSCHENLAETLKNVFTTIHDGGYWNTLHTFGGCYACRPIRGSTHVSTHAWGIAVDLNAAENPLGAVPPDNSENPFIFTAAHPVVKIFKEHGFTWGGEFQHRKDAMHFQFAAGY